MNLDREVKTHHVIFLALVVVGIAVVFSKMSHGSVQPAQVGADITALVVLGG
jgi:hypothetical protein